jgi:hypothetical protein
MKRLNTRNACSVLIQVSNVANSQSAQINGKRDAISSGYDPSVLALNRKERENH